MYIRSTNLRALSAGYLTDYDAELERWLKANPNLNPNSPSSGAPVNPTVPVANAGSSMLMDFVNRRGSFSATVNPNAGVNPNASASSTATVPPTPLTPPQQAPSGASEGVVCSLALRQCPGGAMVGYDPKIKDRCVYLPCPKASGEIKPIGQLFEDAFELDGDGWLNVPFGWLAVGGIALAYMLFRK